MVHPDENVGGDEEIAYRIYLNAVCSFDRVERTLDDSDTWLASSHDCQDSLCAEHTLSQKIRCQGKFPCDAEVKTAVIEKVVRQFAFHSRNWACDRGISVPLVSEVDVRGNPAAN